MVMMPRAVLLVLALLMLLASGAVGDVTLNVRDFGAKGDGKTKDTDAIIKTITMCKYLGGGTVEFPPGQYLTGAFNLSSFTTLFLNAGATIIGSNDLQDFPIVEALPSYGTGRDISGPARYGPLIGAYFVNDVAITGSGGIVDGRGQWWWDMRKQHKLEFSRPHLFECYACKGLLISDVTFKNSPFWTLHPVYSQDIEIRRIVIENPVDSPNTDGIDPDSCSNVLIADSYISCGDDPVAVKSGMGWAGRQVNMPSTNITVVNCTFGAGHGLSVGSEMSGGVSNVVFRDSVVKGPIGAVVKVKTARGRGGLVQNILYQNITFDVSLVGIAIDIDMFYDKNAPPTNASATPTFRDIRVSNFRGMGSTAGTLNCLPESPCREIRFENVAVKSILGFSCQNAFGSFSNVSPTPCLQSSSSRVAP